MSFEQFNLSHCLCLLNKHATQWVVILHCMLLHIVASLKSVSLMPLQNVHCQDSRQGDLWLPGKPDCGGRPLHWQRSEQVSNLLVAFLHPILNWFVCVGLCVSQGYFVLPCRVARPLESMKLWSSGTRIRPVTSAKVSKEMLSFKTWRIYQTSRLCSNACNLKHVNLIHLFYISVIFPNSFLPPVKGLVSFCCLP